jgi:hypothetical protein
MEQSHEDDIVQMLMANEYIRERVEQARAIKLALYRIEDTLKVDLTMSAKELKKAKEDIASLKLGLCFILMELYEANPVQWLRRDRHRDRDIIYKLVHSNTITV